MLIEAFFTSLIIKFETILIKPLSAVSNQLVLVAIICSAVVFEIPSFMLAMVKPFVVKLEDESHNDIGRTSGSIYSLSTIGSILGTFVAVFY